MKEKEQQTGVLPSYFLPDLWLVAGWHTFSVHGQRVHMLGFARYKVSVTTVHSAITSKQNPCTISEWREVAVFPYFIYKTGGGLNLVCRM